MKYLIAFSLIIFTTFACSDDSKDEETICYSFDERQCAGDPWIETIGSSTSDADKIAALKSYLSGESIETLDISIDPDYHTFVCEACYVCPQGPRYTVEISAADSSTITELELLNLEVDNCGGL